MLFHEFGTQYELDELISKIAELSCDMPDAMREVRYGSDQWKRIMYHTLFIKDGIYNPRGSWDMVAQNNVEDVRDTSYVAGLIGRFRTYRVYEKFGIDFKSFLTMPKWLADMILKDAREQHGKELDHIEEAERAANRQDK